MLSETTESPTSPVQDDDDAVVSPEVKPQPGVNGNTVRWYDVSVCTVYHRPLRDKLVPG
ncbi:hypothetical protein EDD15DRAFT_2339831 [Pisolithus albus]|nr:hypothetical protein EDD15DRAFT_2339831 [Pisolithus albus]